jgi:hypothetical protein
MMEGVMEILDVSSNPMEAVPDYLLSAHNGTVGTENGATAGSAGAPAVGGDTVNFSPEALQLSASAGIAPLPISLESMTADMATGMVAYDMVFVSSTGLVTWGAGEPDRPWDPYNDGVELDLSEIGFDNFIIQADSAGNGFHVFNADDTSAQSVELDKDGQRIAEPLAHTAYDASGPGLLVVGNGNYTDAWQGSGMIVNLAANTGASITGGTGSAAIYNFADSVGAISAGTGAGGGNVFTVGLTAGTITVGNGAGDDSSTLTILGNMSDCYITTKGNVIIDAEKCALKDVYIAATVAACATTIKAKNITDGILALGDGPNEVRVSGNMTNTKVYGGEGGDTVIIGGKSSGNEFHLDDGDDVLDIKGAAKDNLISFTGGNNTTSAKSGNGVTYTSGAGNDSVRFYGAVANSTFDLGGGVNSFTAQAVNAKGLDAAVQNLTNVGISATGSSTTKIIAGAYKTTAAATAAQRQIQLGSGANELRLKSIAAVKAAQARIDLSAALNNQLITLTGAMTNANIVTGAGNDTVNIGGAVKNSSFDFGMSGDNALTAKSGNNVTYTSGAGDDSVRFYGAVTNSDFTLGAGANSFTAQAVNAKGVDTALKNLTGVTITANGADPDKDYTIITAGALKSNKNNASAIALLGAGENVVNLKSIAGSKAKGVTIDLGYDRNGVISASSAKQTLMVGGGAKFLSFASGAGNDMLTFLGSISNSFFDLGDGNNTFTAVKQNKQGQDKGQALTNVGMTAGNGDNVATFGRLLPGKRNDPPAVFDLGTGNNTINLIA